MLHKFLIVFLTMQLIHANEYDWSCFEVLEENPPFYISDEYRQGDKVYENFRDIENSDLRNRYIPRGSIVYVDEALYERYDAPSQRVPIKVISVPDDSTEKILKKARSRSSESFRAMMSGTYNKRRVEKDEIGWLDKRSIIPSGKFTFTVHKESPVYNSPNVSEGLPYYMTLKMDDGKYKVKNCCSTKILTGEQTCIKQYQFNIIDELGEVVDTTYQELNQCNFLNESLPIKNEEFDAYRSIINMMKINNPEFGLSDLDRLPDRKTWYNGKPQHIIRKELAKVPIKEDGSSIFGSHHYRRDDSVSSDTFMRPTAFCAFSQVLKEWKKKCMTPGCQVQFGDMYHAKSWGIHQSHGGGECVDIRPFRKADDNTRDGLSYSWSRYDQDKTRKFIKLLREAGGEKLYFNDPVLRKESGGPTYSKGHHDHIHVCFPERTEKIKNTCKNGISKKEEVTDN